MRFSTTTQNYAIGRQNAKCGLCGYDIKKAEQTYDFHHVMPESVSNDNSLDNCVMLCSSCHRVEAHVDGNTRGYVLAKNEYKYFNG